MVHYSKGGGLEMGKGKGGFAWGRQGWVMGWGGVGLGFIAELHKKYMSSLTHRPGFIDIRGWESPETPPLRPRGLPHYLIDLPSPPLRKPFHSLIPKPSRNRSTPLPVDLPLLNAHNGAVLTAKTIDWSGLSPKKQKWSKRSKQAHAQVKLGHSQLNSRTSQTKTLEKLEESRRLNVRLGQPDMQAVTQRSLQIYCGSGRRLG